MPTPQPPRLPSGTPSAAGLLLDRRTFIGAVGSAIAVTALATSMPPATAEAEGWTVLRITEGEIEVNGKNEGVFHPAG